MSDTILITGGTGKIGKQLVNHFYKKGFVVVFTSRSDEHIADLINNRKNMYGIKVDLEKEDAGDVILDYLKKNNIDVNYLVNTARNLDFLKVEDDGSITTNNWLKEYNIDVVIPYKLSFMLSKECNLKKIVNISSMYGMSAFNPHLYEGKFNPLLQYACAKAALIHLTKCMAVMFADKIAVNCVTYGGVEGRVDDEFKKRYANLCPQKRMMREEETIGAVDFLVSDNSTYITGQNIVADGGWSIW